MELEDGRLSGLWLATLQIISYSVVAAIIGANIASIQEVAPAQGELIPAGKIQLIQHLEGGIVDDIPVKEGEEVRAGTVLVRLKDRQVRNDVEQLRSRLAWLTLEEIRLAAEQTRTLPDFNTYKKKYPNFVEHQIRTYNANIQDKEKNNNALKSKIKSLEEEVHALVEELKKSGEELTTQQKLFQMQKALIASGRTPKRTFLEVKSTYQRAATSRAAIKVRLAESKKDLKEAIGKWETNNTKYEKSLAEQRAKVVEQRLELTHQLDKYADRFERLLIRSPIDGVVKDLTPKGTGFVIQAGQTVAEIVPKKQKFIAEVKIRPRDIGHVKIGDPVEMEITTYDSTIYGKVAGKVSLLSSASFKDKNSGDPYFRAEIELDPEYRKKRFSKLPLVSGMLVKANIVTGNKSIMNYLLKPIYKSLDHAFSER